MMRRLHSGARLGPPACPCSHVLRPSCRKKRSQHSFYALCNDRNNSGNDCTAAHRLGLIELAPVRCKCKCKCE
ncbi:hypothetical protein BCR44DRAFT_1246824 [Catenaria anguillulae PL171]|uniref:Uncharacterized protein n=1 Tax=Catenaria anguillulae PL171 TaxID=765915 RepID=A0A1Y2I1U5_9FUNG|nr:hypothetical protein BCR44DRAFT_1246824 [Catenaria anguillulae PL171]